MASEKKRGMSYAQMIGWFLTLAALHHFLTRRPPESLATTYLTLALASAMMWASEWLWHLVKKRYTIRVERRTEARNG